MSGAELLVAIFREMATSERPWEGSLCVVVEGVEKLGDKCYFRVLRLYAAPD